MNELEIYIKKMNFSLKKKLFEAILCKNLSFVITMMAIYLLKDKEQGMSEREEISPTTRNLSRRTYRRLAFNFSFFFIFWCVREHLRVVNT